MGLPPLAELISQAEMRVFAVSDLHTDMRANLTWVRDLDQRRWQQDVLIVAGDVSDKLEILLETMQLLKQTFFEVFFVWGNHDVWDVENSLDKMERIRVEMKRIGVRCEPTLVAGKVWIVPLESWHSFSLEREHECALDLNRLYVWRDFDLCHWPQSMVGGSGSVVGGKFDYREKLAESRVVDKFLCERNELMLSKLTPLLGIRHLPVITFSHFVPRHDLNPRTFTRFPELVAVSVSEQLDEQIRLCRSTIHVFGHTHIRSRKLVDGIEYVQFPLGYPNEGAYCPRFIDLANNELMAF